MEEVSLVIIDNIKMSLYKVPFFTGSCMLLSIIDLALSSII